MDAVAISLPLFCAPKRSFLCAICSGLCRFLSSRRSRCWKPGCLACEPLPTHSYLQEAGVKLLGWGQCFCFGVVSHFLPEPQAGLRANLLRRSRAAGPHLNLWFYSFARRDAVAVAALCIANRTCLRTAVLVGLMIRGFLIFGGDDAA